MTNWITVCGDIYPELLDTTSSETTVYERRNVTHQTVEVSEGVEVEQYVYEERTYTKDEFAEISSPATKTVMQAISAVELQVAMIS